MNESSDIETMTVNPRPMPVKLTFRSVVATLLAAIVMLLAAIWYELWTSNNLDKEARCVSLEYDFDGVRKESLDAGEQKANDIFGCGLDLPLNEDDSDF